MSHLHKCIYTHIDISIYTHSFAYIHTYIHTYTHTHTHTHIITHTCKCPFLIAISIEVCHFKWFRRFRHKIRILINQTIIVQCCSCVFQVTIKILPSISSMQKHANDAHALELKQGSNQSNWTSFLHVSTTCLLLTIFCWRLSKLTLCRCANLGVQFPLPSKNPERQSVSIHHHAPASCHLVEFR